MYLERTYSNKACQFSPWYTAVRQNEAHYAYSLIAKLFLTNPSNMFVYIHSAVYFKITII